MRSNLLSNFAALYSELAEEYDLVFDSSLIGGLMRSPSKKSDAVHFNKQGYSFMAQEMYELLSENGVIN
jgi:lysophospholipase L1-like esterase